MQRLTQPKTRIFPVFYGIMGTPTFVYFCKGRAIKQETGAVHPANLKRSIEELITGGEECVLKTTVLSHEISPYE